ncbi:hypothetical protein [Streptococcus henryi]|nr:hypothetical protein [Streptococcus henryi]
MKLCTNQASIGIGGKTENIATAVAYVIDTPDRMSVNDMIIRPTLQTM